MLDKSRGQQQQQKKRLCMDTTVSCEWRVGGDGVTRRHRPEERTAVKFLKRGLLIRASQKNKENKVTELVNGSNKSIS